MTETIHIQKTERFDVVVCGGGTAGFCAAVAAARGGAKTALIEKWGMLGRSILKWQWKSTPFRPRC